MHACVCGVVLCCVYPSCANGYLVLTVEANANCLTYLCEVQVELWMPTPLIVKLLSLEDGITYHT